MSVAPWFDITRSNTKNYRHSHRRCLALAELILSDDRRRETGRRGTVRKTANKARRRSVYRSDGRDRHPGYRGTTVAGRSPPVSRSMNGCLACPPAITELALSSRRVYPASCPISPPLCFPHMQQVGHASLCRSESPRCPRLLWVPSHSPLSERYC